jgi:DNA adenine methylase
MINRRKMHEPLLHSFADVLTTIADEHKPTVERIAAKPFVKWVGGKRSIISSLVERMPKSYNRYHESFLGGGALFFEIQPENAYLSDINFHLIIAYQAVRDDLETLIELLGIHNAKHDKTHYLQCRLQLSLETNPTKIAALFIYINKTCFNGLYRVNKAGKYNVPMGAYKNPAILDEVNLRGVSKLLQGVDVEPRPFAQAQPKEGDFFYFDPPYHQTYDQYSNDRFADEQHMALAKLCRQIDAAGGYFMLSNSDTDFVKQLYKGFTMEDVMASRNVSCKSDQRGRQNELLIRNYD